MTALEKALLAELESKKELENRIASLTSENERLTSENERLTSENEGLTKALEELKNEKQQSVSELNPSLKESLKQSLASELKQELENDYKNLNTELVEELKELVKNSKKALEDMHKQEMNSLETQENAEQSESEKIAQILAELKELPVDAIMETLRIEENSLTSLKTALAKLTTQYETEFKPDLESVKTELKSVITEERADELTNHIRNSLDFLEKYNQKL